MKKHIFYCLAILSLFTAACGTSRHAITATVRINDTVLVTVHDTFTFERERIEKVYVHDTLLVTPGAKAEQSLNPAAMIPGVPYTTRNGHVRNTMKKDSAGNITAECEADSLKTVVRLQTETIITQANEIKRLSAASTVKTSVTAATYESTYQRGRAWIFRNWHWLFVLIILCFIAEAIHRKALRKSR